MKLYAPKYYLDFKCIADRCQHSCCVGWEIDVDAAALEKYAAIEEDYGKKILESIDYTETPHFCLDASERCPHLDENGLCKIIMNVGEEFLCDICREHPRFYNDTRYGKEVGIGMACEEACRLILSSDSYQEMVEMEELDEIVPEAIEIDTVAERKEIYRILSDRTIPYEERLLRIADDYKVYPEELKDADWRDLLDSLEYMDNAHRELFCCYSSDRTTPGHLEMELERAMAYFIYRNCSSCYTEEEFYGALGFAMVCERLIASIAIHTGAENLQRIAQIVSEELEYCEENKDAIMMEFEF